MIRGAAPWKSATALTLVSLQLSSLLLSGAAWSQAGAQRPPVERGREFYEQSRFDEAIALLKDLVDRGSLSGKDLQTARELLARSYVKKGSSALAKDMFKAILTADPAWRPDPIRVPPDETVVFEQAHKEFEAERAAAPAAPTTPSPATESTPPVRPVPASSVVPPSAKKPLMKQWWVWALGAGVVGGVVAAAASGGGGGGGTPAPNELPYFPSHP